MSDKTHVYEGKVDERQTAAPTVAPEASLFRKRYRALQPDEVRLHDAIKDKADELAALIAALNPNAAAKLVKLSISQIEELCVRRAVADAGSGPDVKTEVVTEMLIYDGANVILALRHLEDAVYRAVKALTS